MVRLSAGGRGLTRETGLRETGGLTLDPRRVPLVSPKWPTGPGGSSTQILRANKIKCESNCTEIKVATVKNKIELQCTSVGNNVLLLRNKRSPLVILCGIKFLLVLSRHE